MYLHCLILYFPALLSSETSVFRTTFKALLCRLMIPLPFFCFFISRFLKLFTFSLVSSYHARLSVFLFLIILCTSRSRVFLSLTFLTRGTLLLAFALGFYPLRVRFQLCVFGLIYFSHQTFHCTYPITILWHYVLSSHSLHSLLTCLCSSGHFLHWNGKDPFFPTILEVPF